MRARCASQTGVFPRGELIFSRPTLVFSLVSKWNQELKKLLLVPVVRECTRCVWVSTCHSPCEVRGQLCGVDSFLPPLHIFWGSNLDLHSWKINTFTCWPISLDQSAKCLQYKHEGPSLDPQHPCKHWRSRDSRVPEVCWLSIQTSEFQVQRKALSLKIKFSTIKEDW